MLLIGAGRITGVTAILSDNGNIFKNDGIKFICYQQQKILYAAYIH